MKTVYLVRHGESEGNVDPIFQGADSPLTEVGKRQAEYVAERCKALPVEAFVASSMVRAQETARIIEEKVGKSSEVSDLFVERRRPSSIIGKSRHDEEAIALEDLWWKSLAGEAPRVSDGEDFDELKARAKKALAFLESRPEKNILVVTHGFFLRALVAYTLFGDALTAQEFKPFMDSMYTANTGISVLRHNAKKTTQPWHVWIWNDHSHLADAKGASPVAPAGLQDA